MSDPFFTDESLEDASDTWEEDSVDMEPPGPTMEETFIDFLLHDDTGPKIDRTTVDLLSNYGVHNEVTLLYFAKYPFDQLLEFFSDVELQNLKSSGLRTLKAYRQYLASHDLITPDGFINRGDFKSDIYGVFRVLHRREILEDFKDALHKVICIRADRACRAQAMRHASRRTTTNQHSEPPQFIADFLSTVDAGEAEKESLFGQPGKREGPDLGCDTGIMVGEANLREDKTGDGQAVLCTNGGCAPEDFCAAHCDFIRHPDYPDGEKGDDSYVSLVEDIGVAVAIFDSTCGAHHSADAQVRAECPDFDRRQTGEKNLTTDGRVPDTEDFFDSTSIEESIPDPSPSAAPTDEPWADPHFFDACDDLDPHGDPYFFDACDSLDPQGFTYVDFVSDTMEDLGVIDVDAYLEQLDYAELRGGNGKFHAVEAERSAEILGRIDKRFDMTGRTTKILAFLRWRQVKFKVPKRQTEVLVSRKHRPVILLNRGGPTHDAFGAHAFWV
jgi:hypothetical protein